MRASVVVIADDLTGAADTGVQFAAGGAPVYLMPAEALSPAHSPWPDGAAGISLYTASRDLSAQAAGERVQAAARALPDPRPRWLYKKIDSCLRGNPGAEIDALLDALGFAAALVAPALPAQGRATIDGIHRVRGAPLAQTRFARDPVRPIISSVVAEILARQSHHKIGGLSLADYGDSGRLQGAVRRERERGCRLIVCDAAEQAHLDRIAALVIQSPESLLPVGSAGLAASLAGQLLPQWAVESVPLSGTRLQSVRRAFPRPIIPGSRTPALPGGMMDPQVTVVPGGIPEPGPPGAANQRETAAPAETTNPQQRSNPGTGPERLLMVCGTGAPVTRRQLDALLARYPGIRHESAAGWLLAASAQDRHRRAAELLAAWTGGILALGVRPWSPTGPAVTPAEAEQGLAGLADLALRVLRAGSVEGLFLSGGETAAAFFRACGGEAIALYQEILPGLVLGRWVGGLADGLPVVTKAGAFGDKQTLAALYERLVGRGVL
ncbi:MAG: four-carbon acid sugar kinase family protein [Candidatus Thiosymbion ectosymbiont of Robbea hypermnestra]|nr:four-carbon acid sugar kinase family protein [Candidatus Thiosymbion ectosymbiont of Robbea hypermnestra]